MPRIVWRIGSYLINDLLDPDFVATLRDDVSVWYRFLGFGTCAVALPSVFRWLRTRDAILRLNPVRHLSLYSHGFEALLDETRLEALQWDERWTYAPAEIPWLMVDTADGHRYMGQMMWRSSVPDPVEVILIDVRDVTDPDSAAEIPGLLLLREETMIRIWVMRPDNTPALV